MLFTKENLAKWFSNSQSAEYSLQSIDLREPIFIAACLLYGAI
jgi:hypothetical protein